MGKTAGRTVAIGEALNKNTKALQKNVPEAIR